jgi:putative addiction module component (TIGR02574 family)
MTTPLESIEAEALKLTPEERARLAERLLASLTEDDIEHAWATEVARRDAEADADPSTLVPYEEAIAQARQIIA